MVVSEIMSANPFSAMTNEAMNGKIPVEAVFGRRLEIIIRLNQAKTTVGRGFLSLGGRRQDDSYYQQT